MKRYLLAGVGLVAAVQIARALREWARDPETC